MHAKKPGTKCERESEVASYVDWDWKILLLLLKEVSREYLVKWARIPTWLMAGWRTTT